MLHGACEETKAGNMSVKESLRYMMNVFLNAVEAPVQECCFDILPHLHIVQSSVKGEFIATCPVDEQPAVMKSQDELDQLQPHSQDVTYKSNIDQYRMRPKVLSSWCLADYVAWIDIIYSGNKQWSHDSTDSDSDNSKDYKDETTEADDIFPYKLHNGITLRRRKKKKIICFVNY